MLPSNAVAVPFHAHSNCTVHNCYHLIVFATHTNATVLNMRLIELQYHYGLCVVVFVPLIACKMHI